MRLRSIFFAMGVAAAGACTPGAVGGDDVVGDDDETLPGTALCQAELTLSGTMISPGTPPTMDQGCVPQGTWTVEVTVASEGTCGEVPMPTTYTYLVEGTGHNTMINPTNNLDQEAAVNITANSQGHCDATFEHIWPAADGFNVALLKPESPTWLQTIEGTGTYQLWAEHP